MENSDKILKEALIRFNVFSEDELKTYSSAISDSKTSLKDTLLSTGAVTEKQILIALSQSLNLQTIDLSTIKLDKSVINSVPIKFAWYYKVIPLKIEKNILHIASAEPLNVKTQDEVRMHFGKEVKVFLATRTQITDAFKKHYGFASETIDKIMTKDTPKERVSSTDSGQWVEDIETKSDDPTVSSLVNQILLEAYKKRATDIHIEPYRDKVRFRYRVDGVLVDANLPPSVKHFLQPILSRIKILANLSITEKRLPQDGSAVVTTKEQQLDLRISTVPTPRGESMVIRILPTKVRLFSLEKLGFDNNDVDYFRKVITKPHGIVFITGPTGSGKTTTLYACLNEINSSETKVITIEDPVEYEMEGVTQVQVNNKVKFTFSTGLRSILRHDPDIIMVGEVRDLETAEISIRTALTGHLVFSTLHTNDAASGIARLIDMGIEPYLVASSVEAFVAQRLVRIICPKCKEEVKDPSKGIVDEITQSLYIKDDSKIKMYKGKGCDHCNNTGYYGRQAIYEILNVNDIIRTAILEKPRSDYIKTIAVREGMRTLRQNGWQAVLNGITTPNEVINVSAQDKMNEEDCIKQQTCFNNFSTNVCRKENEKVVSISGDDTEGRSYPRIFDSVNMRYRLLKRDPKDPKFLLSDGIEHPTHTVDISAAGLGFLSKTALEIGSIFEVKIQLGQGHQNIDCLAKVCRVEFDEFKDVYTIVTYYLDISSADKSLINKYVQLKLKNGAQSKQNTT